MTMRINSSLAAGLHRRGFFRRCLDSAVGFLLPVALRGSRGVRFQASTPEFHFHPQYREKTPLDAALLQIEPGQDGFINEPVHDRIAAILASWTRDLLESPRNTQALQNSLSPSFLGTSLQSVETKTLRPDTAALEVNGLRFAAQPSLAPDAFLSQWRVSLGHLSQILTADFQITEIAARGSGYTTRVRAELVATGQGFYREQRAGEWLLTWERDPRGYTLARWQLFDEVRSRSQKPFYADIGRRAFGSNASYDRQLMHGADYWRTTLDGACGIDVYGHNGVSVGDIDGDGFDDVYVCQPAGLPNRLFRNRGDGTFEDITDSSGVGILENTACALFADFDGDGRQDLVVARASGPLLFLNQGNGQFQLKPNAFRFATPPQGTFTGAAAADYDRDGHLDIYFCLYTYYQGADQYRYPAPYFAAENGPPNFLMHNNGDGTFRDVTAQAGLDKNNTRYSFCCGWGDANGDGWPDLYVVNDFGRKNLYRNNGDGTFRDIAAEAGAEDVGAGMSVCWLDFDNDGAQDLYVGNMWTAAGERIASDATFQKAAPPEIQALYRKHATGNSLLRNQGESNFRDVTAVSRTGMGRWSWSSDAWDFDHDGFPDVYIANGMISGEVREDLNSFFWRQVVAKSPDTAKPSAAYEQGWNAINESIRADYTWSGYERNVFYANNGDGTFSDVSGALGFDFVEDGRSLALADFDHDGRQEVLLKNRNAPQLRLMKSVVSGLPPAIAFRLLGTKSNRDAIGAAVSIETSTGRQSRLLQAGSGFLSQHSKELFFGLGESNGSVSATIRWPSGLIQELKGLPPGHRVSVMEGQEPSRIEPFKPWTPETAELVTQLGETLPASAETWLIAPVAAPDFEIPDRSGKPFRLSSLRGKPALLSFWASAAPGAAELLNAFTRYSEAWTSGGLQLAILNIDEAASRPSFPMLAAPVDVTVTYSLLYRYLFDRRRDLQIPVSFLLDEQSRIVKVYQGPFDPTHVEKDFRSIPRTDAERLDKALPFPGVSTTYEFGRNYLSLGSIFFQRGYMEPAGDFFQAALKDDPSGAEALYGLGSVLLNRSRNAEARDCFERAAKLKANYPETRANAWNNLGLIAARQGETAEAIGYFDQALQIDADHMVALVNLGSAYRQQKRWDDARRTLEHAVAVAPDDAEANYGLGMVYAQANQTDRAYACLRKALDARPAYPEALNNLGILYLRTHKRDEAVATLEKCISADPAFDQAYLNLARVYMIEGNKEKARATLDALLLQRPDHPVALSMLAEIQ